MGTFCVQGDQWNCGTTAGALAFERATVTQDGAGQTVLSFASTVTVRGDVQPEGGTYPRFLAGTLAQVHYTAVLPGDPEVRVGDRTTIDGAQVEVIAALRFGGEQTELSLALVR